MKPLPSETEGAMALSSPCLEAREQSLLPATRESPHSNKDPAQPKINT